MTIELAGLHNHSHFSMMDGISTAEEIVLAAKKKNLRSIAITDHGHCHAHADFFIAGKKHDVKTIYGVEGYVIDSIEQWQRNKDSNKFDKKEEDDDIDTNAQVTKKTLYKRGHLVLLACNQEGLSNIYRLTYKSYKHGFYFKPRMDKQMLKDHHTGIVATSACLGGVIALKCWDFISGRGTFDDIIKEANDYDSIFGRGRFFLELQFNESEKQRMLNKLLVSIHKQTGIPLSVSCDSHYIEHNDWMTQEVLYMLRGNKTVSTKGDNWRFDVKQLYIKSGEELWQSYKKFDNSLDETIVKTAFDNTLLIDNMVENYEPDTHKRLPTIKGIDDTFEELMKRSIAGLKEHKLAKNEVYKKRLLYELTVIRDKGFANYFLVTQSIVQKAKKEMLVGEGRGSAAGSLVCYCLGITDLDPVEHDLMFERFMDPARTEEPDIDIDYEDVHRVKDILREMFGEDNVACLTSYGTFQVKGLLKDLCRVYDVPVKIVNDANKKIEKELKKLYINQDKSTIVIKLEDIRRVSDTFNELMENYPEIERHMDKLYGRIRHASRHAAGVIIGDDLPSETALWVQKDVETGNRITQASFTEGIVNKNISTMGFTKFDVLSIATLKIIHCCLELISQRTGKDVDDLYDNIRSKNMNLNDEKIMENVFWNGNFAGVFQFTEKGIRQLSTNVKPNTFTDISSICSIYRPGPLAGNFDKLFVHNKQHPEDVKYDHDLLKDILKPTRGCIVFQEQLMKICNILGNMSWKDVNAVRKVLLKKDKSKSEEFVKSENERLTNLFLQGCEQNGLKKEKAVTLWKNLLAFGGYGFNKAHSDTYSTMTMKCAYLATYFPLEWYAAVLTKGKSGDLRGYVSDIKRAGVNILPLDINKSKGTHSIEDGSIRLSLNSVKGVGPAVIDKITAGQPYIDFIDFLLRSKASKTAILPLIKAGAFDSLHSNMKDLQTKYDALCENKDYKRKTRVRNKEGAVCWNDYVIYFNESFTSEDYSLGDKIGFENELFSFSLRGSPFDVLNREEKIERYMLTKASVDSIINYVLEYKEVIEKELEIFAMPVLIKKIFEKPQSNGQMMAFLTLESLDEEEFESPCFSGIWSHHRNNDGPMIKEHGVYIITFNKKSKEDNPVIGKPGFKHSKLSAKNYIFDVDNIVL